MYTYIHTYIYREEARRVGFWFRVRVCVRVHVSVSVGVSIYVYVYAIMIIIIIVIIAIPTIVGVYSVLFSRGCIVSANRRNTLRDFCRKTESIVWCYCCQSFVSSGDCIWMSAYQQTTTWLENWQQHISSYNSSGFDLLLSETAIVPGFIAR